MGDRVMIIRALFGVGAVLLLVPRDPGPSSSDCGSTCATFYGVQHENHDVMVDAVAKYRAVLLSTLSRVKADLVDAGHKKAPRTG